MTFVLEPRAKVMDIGSKYYEPLLMNKKKGGRDPRQAKELVKTKVRLDYSQAKY